MLVAYLLALAIGAPVTQAPEVVARFTSIDACMVAAEKLNRATVGDPGSISKGVLHYCAKVVFPV